MKRPVSPNALILLVLFTCPQSWSALVQWPIAQGGNDHFYELVPAPAGISWSNANIAATNRGGYLATITSAAENTFVFNLATPDATVWYSGYGPWLGGVQPAGSVEPAGGWAWVTGEPFTYRNWAQGQPNNNQNEDRLQFGGQADRSSAWNDINQNSTNFTRGFIVEYDHHPNATTLYVAIKDSEQIQLTWPSRLNISYTIEWTDDLNGQWNVLTTIVGNGATLTVNDSLANKARYYRSSAPP